MGAGHKEKITTASDVMSGLRLSLSRRRTIELWAGGRDGFLCARRTGSRGTPEVFFSPEVSADALIRIYEKLSGDLSGCVGIKIHGGEAAVNLPLFVRFRPIFREAVSLRPIGRAILAAAAGIRQRILPKFAARASTLRRWTCSTERSTPEDYVKLPIPGGANLKEIEVCRAMLRRLWRHRCSHLISRSPALRAIPVQ